MKLEKAIEVLKGEMECWSLHPEVHLPKAIKLGIEALKEVQRLRRVEKHDPTIMLPGEAE